MPLLSLVVGWKDVREGPTRTHPSSWPCSCDCHARNLTVRHSFALESMPFDSCVLRHSDTFLTQGMDSRKPARCCTYPICTLARLPSYVHLPRVVWLLLMLRDCFVAVWLLCRLDARTLCIWLLALSVGYLSKCGCLDLCSVRSP